MKISLIIRTYNEATQLAYLLQQLEKQDLPKTEWQAIVVDNGSTDHTAEVCRRHVAEHVLLPQEEFTYPHSSNVGCSRAKGEIIVLISAHCQLVHDNWLSHSLEHFSNPKVAGIYGPTIPVKQHSAIEWWMSVPAYWIAVATGVRRISRPTMGVFGATNCALRTSLWKEHPFDEEWAAGAEDTAWASWALKQNKLILFDPHFVVRHSHNLGLRRYWQQWKYWAQVHKGPQPFRRSALSYRSDFPHLSKPKD
jgi:rhamnosyltransferase